MNLGASRQSRAVLAMLLAVALFSLMDAGLKGLAGHYPPFQVAALRGAASLPFVVAWATATAGPGTLLRVRWSLHLLRGVLGVVMMAAFAYALRRMPLSTAYSIFFVAPLLIRYPTPFWMQSWNKILKPVSPAKPLLKPAWC